MREIVITFLIIRFSVMILVKAELLKMIGKNSGNIAKVNKTKKRWLAHFETHFFC